MCFVDFSVNYQPISMKFSKNNILTESQFNIPEI